MKIFHWSFQWVAWWSVMKERRGGGGVGVEGVEDGCLVEIFRWMKLSFSVLYKRWVLSSKWNVTSKKSASVRLVTTSVFQPALWKALRITFFRSLSVSFLLILQSSFSLSSRYTPNVSLSIIQYAKMEYKNH